MFSVSIASCLGRIVSNIPKEANGLHQWIWFVQRIREWNGILKTSHISCNYCERGAIMSHMEIATDFCYDDVPTIYLMLKLASR